MFAPDISIPFPVVESTPFVIAFQLTLLAVDTVKSLDMFIVLSFSTKYIGTADT